MESLGPILGQEKIKNDIDDDKPTYDCDGVIQICRGREDLFLLSVVRHLLQIRGARVVTLFIL